MVVLCPLVALAAAPVQQTLKQGVPAPHVVLPPIPPGNVLFRMNGTRAITRHVFPTLANVSGALNQDIASITLVDREATVGEPPFKTGIAVRRGPPT